MSNRNILRFLGANNLSEGFAVFPIFSRRITDRSPNIRMIKSRKLTWAGHVARMGERRDAYRVLVRKLEGRRPLERPRRR